MSDKTDYRKTLGKFATGVTIITTCTKDEYYGFTANSFTSVSLDPPLVLFCIKTDANFMNALEQSRIFGVNILSSVQRELSNKFANPQLTSRERFTDVVLKKQGECPQIDGTIAFLECSVIKMTEEGDHHIIIGEVKTFLHESGKEPLLYYSGSYRSLSS